MHRTIATAALAVLTGAALIGTGCERAPAPTGGEHDHHAHADEVPVPTRAVCVLVPTAGSSVKGTVTFLRKEDGIHIHAEITGLTPGKHGFHVHEFGDLTAPDGTSAGGHWNPGGHDHSLPGAAADARHVGDLGNLEADANGRAVYDRVDKVLTLGGPHAIIGRGMIVHAKEDDGGQPTGNAGGRVAMGVIGVAKE